MDLATIEEGMAALVAIDPAVAQAYVLVGNPPVRQRPPGFGTLFNTIISQQISTEAARAIVARVSELLPELNAESILASSDRSLRDAGLSRRKVEYAKGLAEAVYRGDLDIDGLATLSDEEAIAAISSLRGFGRWSAEIYLMFSLGRTDLFPADDLALRVALGRLKELDDRPSAAQARSLVAAWAPWRSVGSLFLWHYYRGAPT